MWYVEGTGITLGSKKHEPINGDERQHSVHAHSKILRDEAAEMSQDLVMEACVLFMFRRHALYLWSLWSI